jgi:hypothetical protein
MVSISSRDHESEPDTNMTKTKAAAVLLKRKIKPRWELDFRSGGQQGTNITDLMRHADGPLMKCQSYGLTENFIVRRGRIFNLFISKNIWGTVIVINDSFHRFSPESV